MYEGALASTTRIRIVYKRRKKKEEEEKKRGIQRVFLFIPTLLTVENVWGHWDTQEGISESELGQVDPFAPVYVRVFVLIICTTKHALSYVLFCTCVAVILCSASREMMTKFFCLSQDAKEKLSILFLSALKAFISSACMLDLTSSRGDNPIF